VKEDGKGESGQKTFQSEHSKKKKKEASSNKWNCKEREGKKREREMNRAGTCSLLSLF